VDQPEFRNGAVALDVPAGPDPATGAAGLLVALKGLERAFGRRPRARWGPREVDLDLLVFGRHAVRVPRPPAGRSDDPAKAALPLVVPHVEARERLFVLAPLEDLAPGLVPPGWGETVATAAARRRRIEGADAARPVARWTGRGWEPLSPGRRAAPAPAQDRPARATRPRPTDEVPSPARRRRTPRPGAEPPG
jgi:2-amino-4-hydroxy-6-hydroxymethyldihydropteridine diphosphokinase